MGTKTAVSFANIFMAHIETTILRRTVIKAKVWKRYFDDIVSLWDISKPDIEAFIEQAVLHHPTIKFTAQICDTETMAQDIEEKSILDVKDTLKKNGNLPVHTFHLFSPAECYKRICQRRSLENPTNKLLQMFEENNSNFKKRLIDRGYPQTLIENLLSKVKSSQRGSLHPQVWLKHNNKEEKEILPFLTQYKPSVSTLKESFNEKMESPIIFSKKENP